MKNYNRLYFGLLLFAFILFISATSHAFEKSLDQGLDEIAQKVTKSIPEGKKKTVAVMDFNTLDGNVTMLGRFVSEELITKLFETERFKVIERSLLDKAILELKFNTSDLVDPSVAKQLGKVVGADAIVTGTLSDIGQSVKINARVIMVESGEVIGAAGAQIVKDTSISDMMKKKVVNSTSAKGQKVVEKNSTGYDQLNVSEDELPSGVVSYWKFDEGNRLMTVDSISKDKGSVNGAVWTEAGISGSALVFNGTAYIGIPNIIRSWNQGTIETWVKYSNPTPGRAGSYVYSATQKQPLTGGFDGTDLGIHPDYGPDIRFGTYASTWNWAASGIIPVPGEWYHIVGVWGFGGIKIYVNGTLRGTNPYNGPSFNSNYNIIGASSWPGSSINGVIDEVVIYNRELTANEVAQRYKLYMP